MSQCQWKKLTSHCFLRYAHPEILINIFGSFSLYSPCMFPWYLQILHFCFQTCDSFSISFFRLLFHFIQIYHIFFNAGPGVSTDHCYTDLRSSLSLSFSLLHSLLFTPFWYTQEVISFSATHSFSINSYCWSCLLFSFNI